MDDTPADIAPALSETSTDTRRWISRWDRRLPAALSEAPELAAASVILASRGIPVFPCTPGGKQPLTRHGFHDASADVATVRNWWRRWPAANVGVPTGSAGGVDVVDVDVHSGGSGFAAFEGARSAGLADGWAWLVRTPSGGVHAYYLRGLLGTGSEQRSWQVPSRHVDFRGDGGYIIGPPSRVNRADGTTRRYELIALGHHPARPLNATALRAFLEPPRPMRPPAGMPAMGARPDKLAAWVASRPEGARNRGLFWAACRLAEDGHDLSTTTTLLGEAACSAGLLEREAMSTIRSAYRIAGRLGAGPRPPSPVTTPPRPTRAVEAVAL